MPPPPALGSGKLGTPCERMQSANLIAALALSLSGLAEDPHAGSATAAMSASGKPAAFVLRTLLWSLQAMARVYRTADNRAVTALRRCYAGAPGAARR